MSELKKVAKEFVEGLISDLDGGGSNYSPDLRDSLFDNRDWLERHVADLLKKHAALK